MLHRFLASLVTLALLAACAPSHARPQPVNWPLSRIPPLRT